MHRLEANAAPVADEKTPPSHSEQSTAKSSTSLGSAVDIPARSSRLPGFYELPLSERLASCKAFSGLDERQAAALGSLGCLTGEMVDVFIENAIGSYALPLGVATNFLVDGRDLLIPMAVEETSVVAAASHGAKLARFGGGFTTSCDLPIMTGQVQLFVKDLASPAALTAIANLATRRQDLIDFANRGQERLIERGGGVTDLEWRPLPEIDSLVLHVHVNVCDAMGANIVNTICEKLSTVLPGVLNEAGLEVYDVGLRILTNLTDRRLARSHCRVPASCLTTREFDGAHVARRIVMAWQFADADVYRATTNNKGVMNGIDPVLIATGNDWRAIEAGAHAYACKDGRYRPLAKWSLDANGDLIGELTVPMAVGVVGGVTKLHPAARAALAMMGMPDAAQLSGIVASVGLAQNLSALRALASEGIQRGHMSLHQSNLDLLQRHGATRS